MPEQVADQSEEIADGSQKVDEKYPPSQEKPLRIRKGCRLAEKRRTVHQSTFQ